MQIFNTCQQLLQLSIFINITLGKKLHVLISFNRYMSKSCPPAGEYLSQLCGFILGDTEFLSIPFWELYFAILSHITGDTENSCCRSCSWGVLRVSDFPLSNIFIIYFNIHEKGQHLRACIKKSHQTRLIYTLLGHHNAKIIFLYEQFLA